MTTTVTVDAKVRAFSGRTDASPGATRLHMILGPEAAFDLAKALIDQLDEEGFKAIHQHLHRSEW